MLILTWPHYWRVSIPMIWYWRDVHVKCEWYCIIEPCAIYYNLFLAIDWWPDTLWYYLLQLFLLHFHDQRNDCDVFGIVWYWHWCYSMTYVVFGIRWWPRYNSDDSIVKVMNLFVLYAGGRHYYLTLIWANLFITTMTDCILTLFYRCSKLCGRSCWYYLFCGLSPLTNG